MFYLKIMDHIIYANGINIVLHCHSELNVLQEEMAAFTAI